MLVGVWPTWRGKVRLDGAALEQWLPEELGQHIGYLPQDVELFAGTVAQNIARFHRRSERRRTLIRAAMAADVHEMILRLPQGYETQVGEGGAATVRRTAPAHRPRPRALSAIRSSSCSTSRTPTSTTRASMR